MINSKKHENHTLSTEEDIEIKKIIKKEIERQKVRLFL